jgi:hypothetical protein
MNVEFFGNDDGFESVIIPNGYQQANQPPQCPDVEWDWFQEIDDDLWIAELAQGPVGLDALPRPVEDPWDWTQDDDEQAPLDQSPPVVVVSATQYFGDDAEQFDEALEPAIVQSGFQQADAAVAISPTQYFGDDSEQFDEALEHAIVPAGFQQADAAAVAPSQFFEEPFDWEDSPPDYMADDFGNDDADPPVADAWDWSYQDDDEQAVPDDPIGADVTTNPVQFYEDGADLWNQDADDDTFVALDSDPVGASIAVATVQPPDDPFEAPQDADDDEWIARDSDPVGANTIAAPAQAFEDAWDWASDDVDNDFEWALEPNALIASIPIPPSQFTDDAWDWSQDDEEVLAVTDEALSANLPTTAIAISDDWNWVSCDADNDFDWALEPNVLFTILSTLLPRIIVTPNANRAVVPNADRTLVASASRKLP